MWTSASHYYKVTMINSRLFSYRWSTLAKACGRCVAGFHFARLLGCAVVRFFIAQSV